MSLRTVTLAGFIAALCAASAMAEPPSKPKPVIKEAPRITAPLKPIPKPADPNSEKTPETPPITTRGVTGLIPVTIDLRPVYKDYEITGNGAGSDVRSVHNYATGALSAFHLNFLRDDHQLKTIGLLNEAGEVRAALTDVNGGDRFAASARYKIINDLPVTTLSSNNCVRCEMAFRDQPAGTVAVLAGFWIERITEADANVRAITVELDQQTKMARVQLSEDGTRPFGGGRKPEIPVRVIVQVIYVPANLVAEQVKLKSIYQPGLEMWTNFLENGVAVRASDQELRNRLTDQAVLQGFSFHFDNADHFLKEIRVDLTARTALVHLQDANTDDPYTWTVNAAVLVPGR